MKERADGAWIVIKSNSLQTKTEMDIDLLFNTAKIEERADSKTQKRKNSDFLVPVKMHGGAIKKCFNSDPSD